MPRWSMISLYVSVTWRPRQKTVATGTRNPHFHRCLPRFAHTPPYGAARHQMPGLALLCDGTSPPSLIELNRYRAIFPFFAIDKWRQY
jgi:hypothetical protein